MLALEQVHRKLQSLGNANLLDEKLAEYAFFPLTHIFNQSQRLSSSGLELAVRCVQILVSTGWREKLAPEMAKQLLVLLGLLVSRNPKQQIEPATDELKVACFDCMAALLHHCASSAFEFIDGVGSKNIVDQLVYQLLEALTLTVSGHVQISAATALLRLTQTIKNRALLASLLPRTVSTLVKVLRPSTHAKRTRKVLVAYINLLREFLRSVLADDVISRELTTLGSSSSASDADEETVLDQAWLNATTPQIDLALVQVVKIKNQESDDVAEALLELCLMIVNDCSQTLNRSLPLMVDTLTALSASSISSKANAALKQCITARPEMAEILGAKFYSWSQALPRVMQGNNDRPKKQLLQQVATSFVLLAETSNIPGQAPSVLASLLIDTVAAAIGSGSPASKIVSLASRISPSDLIETSSRSTKGFLPVVLSHRSQSASTEEMKRLVASLKTQPFSRSVIRSLVDHLHNPDANTQLSAAWLALEFLSSKSGTDFDILELIETDSTASDLSLSRPFLISDLYSNTLPFLTQYPELEGEDQTDWRLIALSLESLVLQATQLSQAYRPELVDTLFPLLTMLSSQHAQLQQHAMTTLDALAAACEYESTAHMLIENVDYLINAVALRLNAFDVSRSSLQVIIMMVKLCGARILSYLDDLIGSVFGALDNFHGYPTLVEQLFELLRTIVNQSSKTPAVLAIDAGLEPASHNNKITPVSGLNDILDDLRTRTARKSKTDEEHELTTAAPHRSWGAAKDDDLDTEAETISAPTPDNEDEQPLKTSTKSGQEPKLSKSHQLLLNIARSTVPHMSSPSPAVRHTLLELLQDICPLLAAHENSFLPLVNAMWPAVVSRLLSRDGITEQDAAYNITAAATTMGVICVSAGDFMASRIEDVFPHLEALFRKTYMRTLTGAKMPHPRRHVIQTWEKSDSILVQSTPASDRAFNVLHQLQPQHQPQSSAPIRTSDSQLLQALTNLLLTILANVRITQDTVDGIFALLTPLMSKKAIRDAMVACDEDAVWLLEHEHDRS